MFVIVILSLLATFVVKADRNYDENIYHKNYTQWSFSLPMAGLKGQLASDFYVGNSFFKKNWVSAPASTTARTGLGPHFIARSCSSCHFMDGRSQPDQEMTGLQLKLSMTNGSINAHSGHQPLEVYGSLLTTRAINNIPPEGQYKITYSSINGLFDDGTPYQLIQPEYHIDWSYQPPDQKINISARVAPHLIGMGLLENINDQDIMNKADPNDKDGDGISGKINWVWDESKRGMAIGRFGWKASIPSVKQQVASALINDMGITNPMFTQNLCHFAESECQKTTQPEISEKIFNKLVLYSQTLAMPMPRRVAIKDFTYGQKLFDQAQCSSCHTPQQKTGAKAKIDVLINQTFYPYTDMLLHDMGPGLSDGRPDFLATGSEWRTPPLWGIGLIEVVNNHSRYLHDGRARNITEAILWHGGEAQSAQKAFLSMNAEQRKALILFIKSL